MQILFSPYTLIRKDRRETQQGALLKISGEGFFGVADICPKIELGDLDLKTQILQQGPLYKRALQLATEDLEARRGGRSLLLDKQIKNNLLITDYNFFSDEFLKIEDVTFKFKADGDVDSFTDFLNRIVSQLFSGHRLRIDFNSKLDVESFDRFLNLVSDKVVQKIEYIEDPTTLCDDWKRWNTQVPLAVDFQKNLTYSKDHYTYTIIKPARESLSPNLNRFTLTSSMDHPIGVAHGLRVAQQAAQNDSGFLTLDLYEDCGFNKYYNRSGVYLNFSKAALDDTGIGMTEELSGLKWLMADRMFV